MGPLDWQREGTHSEVGRYTVERWLEIYADHAHNHAAQIRRARASAQ
jgi:Arc/MetJ-type ribon-helix-helix transcriptional regulator